GARGRRISILCIGLSQVCVMTEESLFAKALQKSTPAERAAFLDEACSGDAALRQRVEALLQSHGHADFLKTPAIQRAAKAAAGIDELPRPRAQAGSFMGAPAQDRVPQATASAPMHESPGTVIGPYKLLQQIGEGGM